MRNIPVCSVFLFFSLIPTSFAQFDDDEVVQPESQQAKKVFAAIELAKMAAEADQPDVSFEAIKRAAATGPVISKVDLGGLLSSPQQNTSSMSSSSSGAVSPQQQAATKAAAKMIEVSDLWAKKNFDAERAYGVWFEQVFPKDSPQVINLHSQSTTATNRNSYNNFSLTGAPAKPLKTGAQCLIDWAIKVDKLAALEVELTKRQTLPGNSDIGWLFKIWIADANKAGVEVYEKILSELEPKLPAQIVGNNSDLKTQAIRESLKKLPTESELKSRLKKAFVKALPTTSNWTGNPKNMEFLRELIVESIDTNDMDSSEAIAEAIVSQWSNIRSGNESYVRTMESQAFSELSRVAFGKKAFGIGSVWMQRATLGAAGSGEASSSFSLRGDSAQNLLLCPQDIRYEILSKQVWTAPMLGLGNMSAMMPRFLTSTLFRSDEKSPLLQIANSKAASISALEWLMRDAIALGKPSEIEQRIAGLAESKSDDLALATLVWKKAKDQAFDIQELVKNVAASGDTKATSLLQRLVQADSPPLAIEVEIAEIALQDKSTQQLGVEYTKRLLESCLKHNKTALMSQCRAILYSAAKSNESAPATQERLKHFVEASDWDGGAILDGIPSKPLWLSRNDSHTSWGHETSAMQSYLFLKYPLVGDYEIEFKARDGSYSEPGIAIGGVLAEFCPYDKTIALSSIGFRHMGSMAKKFDKYKQGEWNQYRVKRSSTAFHVFINGKAALTIPVDGSETPFFGLGAKSYRSSSFDELKILGKVEIPRKVDLCTPRLAGWSSYYTQQYLQPIQMMAKDPDETPEDEDSEGNPFGGQGYDFDSEEAQAFPIWYGRENGDADYAWVCKDGVLASTDQKIAREKRMEKIESKVVVIGPDVREMMKQEPKKTRSIGLIYYERPMCDGETIELEFYQDSKPDPVEGRSRSLPLSISPTIGRTAMLLDQPEVALRWIAGEGEKEWLGTDPDQRVVDPQARQIAKAQINEKAWNTLKIRWNRGSALMSINGQDVYERKWDSEAAPQFGLYHHPNQTQTRVRNVSLSGNWPEALPSNLFEMNP